MKSSQFWFEKIIDAMTALEMRWFKPTDLYIHKSIIDDIAKDCSGYCKKGVFSVTHMMGMKIHNTNNIREFRMVDNTIKCTKNYELL